MGYAQILGAALVRAQEAEDCAGMKPAHRPNKQGRKIGGGFQQKRCLEFLALVKTPQKAAQVSKALEITPTNASVLLFHLCKHGLVARHGKEGSYTYSQLGTPRTHAV